MEKDTIIDTSVFARHVPLAPVDPAAALGTYFFYRRYPGDRESVCLDKIAGITELAADNEVRLMNAGSWLKATFYHVRVA